MNASIGQPECPPENGNGARQGAETRIREIVAQKNNGNHRFRQFPKLRPFQTEAVQAILKRLAEFQSTAVAMPTGSGKTVVFCEVARQLGARTLVLAHREELFEQA